MKLKRQSIAHSITASATGGNKQLLLAMDAIAAAIAHVAATLSPLHLHRALVAVLQPIPPLHSVPPLQLDVLSKRPSNPSTALACYCHPNGAYLLGTLDAKTHMTVGITHNHEGLQKHRTL
jgi:hypothetical protein